MNKIANEIRSRLSLRPPQETSLNILADLADKLNLKKNADLTAEMEKVNSSYPKCRDFERNFPSICFALATGVGKTRLMGAFVAYLYRAKKSKNFLILAPNLTVYNKLIEDFRNINNPKYVFPGIGEFVHNPPRIITGDDYNQRGMYHASTIESPATINIFNISKINSETRGGKAPKIKRLIEIMGDSYFNYLAELDDLVVLMDESHHYRAERGMAVINELNPILGLELTATPKVEKSGGTEFFRNVVYEYTLASAIKDGFVKEPAVATRKDFDPSQYNPEELDRIKLEDGIRLHEDTKVALDIYARNNRKRTVKPFVLVVAKDTEHAGKLMNLIRSRSFFEGYYSDKVIEIHSNQTGSEKDENIAQLVSLENPDNRIEIVVHVNMLKEGWDVTNLYTIVPLRTATSMVLREQTIGRGLRLPYGSKTGDKKADKLTIVAHDRFQEIIDEANKPDSIINKENIIFINEDELNQHKEVVTSKSSLDLFIEEQEEKIEKMEIPEEKEKAETRLKTDSMLINTIYEMSRQVKNIKDLKNEDIKKIAITNLKKKIENQPQMTMFTEEQIQDAEKRYDEIAEIFEKSVIEIPRINIVQSDIVKAGFHDLDLDVKNLNYQPVSEEIISKLLQGKDGDYESITGKGRIIVDNLENLIVNELINKPEIDYDKQADLLFKLAGQAMDKFKSYLTNEDDLINVIQYHKKEIGDFIYSQMMEHFYCEAPEYEKPEVFPFTKIEEHNYPMYSTDKIRHYTETITPTSLIPAKLFSGFKKACHPMYKFDSKAEKDFCSILESNELGKNVVKWLRPARNQFRLYWDRNTKRYEPDFVVETGDSIYLIEIKKESDVNSDDVQQKAKSALHYCRNASDYTTKNGGKPWKYLLIPHNTVEMNRSFEYYMNYFEKKSAEMPECP